MTVGTNDLLLVSLEQCEDIGLRLKGLFWLIRVLMERVGCIVRLSEWRPLLCSPQGLETDSNDSLSS